MGEVVGDGVGEREGAAEIVAERWRRRRSNGNDGGFMVKRERERLRKRRIVSEKVKERKRRRRKRKIGFFKDGSCDSWVLYTFSLLFLV
jgi:hypothetical protein